MSPRLSADYSLYPTRQSTTLFAAHTSQGPAPIGGKVGCSVILHVKPDVVAAQERHKTEKEGIALCMVPHEYVPVSRDAIAAVKLAIVIGRRKRNVVIADGHAPVPSAGHAQILLLPEIPDFGIVLQIPGDGGALDGILAVVDHNDVMIQPVFWRIESSTVWKPSYS